MLNDVPRSIEPFLLRGGKEEQQERFKLSDGECGLHDLANTCMFLAYSPSLPGKLSMNDGNTLIAKRIPSPANSQVIRLAITPFGKGVARLVEDVLERLKEPNRSIGYG